jgi:EmrB/QacA subfamily drug resistance transporter
VAGVPSRSSERSHGERQHPSRTLLILGVAGLAYALAQTTVVPAIPDLMRGLHTDQSGVTWTLTGYLVSAAVCTPLVGRLGDIFGKRRLLVITLATFALGSVVSAVTGQLGVVVAGRVIQGLGGGIFPLCFAIIRDEFPRDRIARAVGLMSSIVGIGGGFGLILGGLIVDHLSYHWIFWLGAAMGVIGAAAVELFVPESPIRTPARLDVRGAVVLASGLTLPLIAISQANAVGWAASRTLLELFAGAAVLVFWVWLQRRTPQPLADIAALARPPVLLTNVATLLVGFGMFGSYILIPTLAEADRSTGYGFGVGATRAGLLLLPGSLAMLFLGPLSGVIGTRFSNRISLAIGGLGTAAGLALLAWLHHDQLEVAIFATLMSGGIALAFAAMPNLILEAVPAQQTGEATGFNALVRSVGSSLGSQVSAAVLASGAVAGVAADAGFRDAFLVSAGVALGSALIAVCIPRVSVDAYDQPIDAVEQLAGA